MTPRPLYRWKSFWFGILVLGFLGWAWADSLSTSRDAYFHRQGLLWRHGDSRAVFHLIGTRGWVGSDDSGIRFHSYNLKSSKRLSLPVVRITERVDAPTTVQVPYWFLILLVLVSWCGWLAWRWRKIKRLDATRQEVFK